jgi:5-methyltetrahydropteroyltriglutamate--homocysteine methyltransferase
MASDFRADQIGSLLRPAHLLQARAEVTAGTRSADALTALEDEAILAALERQRETGIGVYVDGEFRRDGFMTGFPANVSGFRHGVAVATPWRGGSGEEGASPNTQLLIADTVRSTGRIAQAEAAFLREHAPGPFKITLPSPVNFAFLMWRRGVSDTAYPTPSDFLADAAAILADEVRALVAEGVPYIHLDAPTYTHWADESLKQGYRDAGFDLDTFLDDAIAAENAILDAAGGGATTAVHLCRGNSVGRWLAEGGYDAMAEKLFGELRCDRLLLEYDDERSGGFEPLRFVPDDRVVVLGLISTKRAALESRDEVLRRIDAATRFVAVDRLALSPQCGFASSGRGNPISEDEQWRKLELVASVADEVWAGASV